jgi:hypothetical protein
MAITMTDSRGSQSTTLALVMTSWAVVTLKYLLAGFTLPLIGLVAPMGATEYSLAVGAIMGIWLGREYQEKKLANGNAKATATTPKGAS